MTTTTEKPFIPSPQQAAIFDWVETGEGNADVQAVAGSGKTTTIVKACGLMTGTVAFAAFNKKIASEIEARLEPLGLGNRVQAGTFHKFGLRAWSAAHRGVQVAKDNEKRDLMLLALTPGADPNMTLAELRAIAAQRRFVPGQLDTIIVKLVSLAKQSACGLFWQPTDRSKWYDIVDHHDLTYDMEEPAQIEEAIDLAIRGLRWCQAVGGELIDFDDMIWLPVITDVRVYQNDWVLVDESQDTNPARRALARKMLKPTGRAIFVGDEHQAIYGFTGADNDAIKQIVRDFGCKSLPLTVTYRCPKAVVTEARKYVSHIAAHESAPEGMTRSIGKKEFLETTIPTLDRLDVVLCRNTKPLVSLAFNLIRRGIACHVEGRDIGNGLIKLAQRWKVKTAVQLRSRLEDYREREVAKLQAKGRETQAEAVNDRVETLLVLADGCDTLQCVIDKILKLFQDTPDGRPAQTLTLSTVHKAKGREWGRVFILGFSKYMPSPWARQAWQQEQERNIIYVAITRAQAELAYVEALEDAKPAGAS